MTSTYDAYRMIIANMARSLKSPASQPSVTRETAYFNAKIGNVTSIESFVSDTRLLTYAMTAFVLGDIAYAKAFVTKVLQGGVDSTSSFANQFSDQRYREFVKAFDFKTYGATTTQRPEAQAAIVDLYQRQSMETQAGEQDDGVRLAFYFQRKAGTLKNSYGIPADAALLKVAQVALGLPVEMSRQSSDKQAQMLDQKLAVADQKVPAKLEKFLMRFTSLWEAAKSPSVTPTILLTMGGSQATISPELALSFQGLRTR